MVTTAIESYSALSMWRPRGLQQRRRPAAAAAHADVVEEAVRVAARIAMYNLKIRLGCITFFHVTMTMGVLAFVRLEFIAATFLSALAVLSTVQFFMVTMFLASS